MTQAQADSKALTSCCLLPAVVIGAAVAVGAAWSLARGSGDEGTTAVVDTSAFTAAARFEEAFANGADCATLIALKVQISRNKQDVTQVQDKLRSVGCYSASDSRVEPRSGGDDAYSMNYKVSYVQCREPTQLYQDAGTRDKKLAAAYLSEVMVPGVARAGSYDGCLDALNGKQSKFKP